MKLETAQPRRITLLAYQLAGAAVVVGIWCAATYTGAVNEFVLPTPLQVARSLGRGIDEGVLIHHTLMTLRSFAISFGIAIVLGVALGTAPGLMPSVNRSIQPLVSLALTLPIVTYFAVLVVLFGYGFWSVLCLGVVSAAPSMLVSTTTAFQEIDKNLVRVGSVYCSSRWSRYRRILLPASLATLSSGVKIAAGRAIMGVIVGEMFMASDGLGAYLITSSGFFDNPATFSIVVMLAVVSYVIAVAFAAVENRMARFNG